jgi:hypothetical protein
VVLVSQPVMQVFRRDACAKNISILFILFLNLILGSVLCLVILSFMLRRADWKRSAQSALPTSRLFRESQMPREAPVDYRTHRDTIR